MFRILAVLLRGGVNIWCWI